MQGQVTRVSRGKQMERCFNLVFTVTKNSETCVDKNLEWLSVGSQAQRYMLHKVVREPLLFRETISGQHKSSQLSFCSPLLETSLWTSLSKHLKTSSPPWVASLTAPERRGPEHLVRGSCGVEHQLRRLRHEVKLRQPLRPQGACSCQFFRAGSSVTVICDVATSYINRWRRE